MSMTREEAIDVVESFRNVVARMENTEYTVEALDMAISALRPVSREQVEKVWRGYWDHKEVISNKSITGKFLLPSCECSLCGCYVQQEVNFCPHCGAAQTDEAVDMMLKRMEEIYK